MNQVVEFFQGLFSTSEWPARWHCGRWTSFHGWLYILSDLSIWVAYFMIPLFILNYFYKKKKNIRFQRVYVLFAAFILLCGTTHFADAMMFWVPMYRLNAVIRFVTAVVSLLTVYYMVKVLPLLTTQKTNVELEQEIALRKTVEQKLEAANLDLEAFAAVASHDLKEPLRKIAMFTSLLDKRNKEHFDDTSKEYAQKILQSSEKMQLLINDILTLSSLQNDIELLPVDLNIPIGQAIENLEVRIRETKANIEIGPLPVVAGNESFLAQLFYNLLNNALKFTNKQPVIKITSAVQDGYTWVYVKDNGIGIKPADFQKIFESLSRLNSKAEYEGNGLGLAICKKIADAHHGIITVSSEENEGSTFAVRLNNV